MQELTKRYLTNAVMHDNPISREVILQYESLNGEAKLKHSLQDTWSRAWAASHGVHGSQIKQACSGL